MFTAAWAFRRPIGLWRGDPLVDVLCPSASDDPSLREHSGRFQRLSASPSAAVSYLDSLLHMNVRPAISVVSAPTLILHATRDRADPIEAARYTAARISNAKLVELNSGDHLIWLTDALETMVNEIQDFVAEAVPFHDVARPLATMLCVNVPPGPPADGAGLHCGECEITGAEGARRRSLGRSTIGAQAPAGHVVVTRTVRDLVDGSEITFTDHVDTSIEGLPGGWSAYLVVDA